MKDNIVPFVVGLLLGIAIGYGTTVMYVRNAKCACSLFGGCACKAPVAPGGP